MHNCSERATHGGGRAPDGAPVDPLRRLDGTQRLLEYDRLVKTGRSCVSQCRLQCRLGP